jgi:phosphoribosylanthranilate isomerase
MVKVKICGITRLEDALNAVKMGVDALGFVFYPQSPRYIQPEKARAIIAQLPPFVTPVGVFVNEKYSVIANIIGTTRIQGIQLHGEESPEFCQQFSTKTIKAFRIQEPSALQENISRYHVDAILLDTYAPDTPGGTGKTFPWEVAIKVKLNVPVILAGGLTPENVVKAIKRVAPYAVDVSSGIEIRPGYKDEARMRQFVQRVRQCYE